MLRSIAQSYMLGLISFPWGLFAYYKSYVPCSDIHRILICLTESNYMCAVMQPFIVVWYEQNARNGLRK